MSVIIHSFIHSVHLYSAPSRTYSEALPVQPRPKKKVLSDLKKPVKLTWSSERSSSGRSFQIDGPTIENARRWAVTKRARGTKSSSLAAECRTLRAATSDTGRQKLRR